jgi:predicted RND superfamily exporter protein
MVFGLGVDFALHLMVRLRQERAAGASPSEALDRTFATTGPPIVVGGCTTAGALFLLSLADDPAARHLGLAGGTGLVLCMLLTFTVLPASWTLVERFGSDKARERAGRELPVAWVQRLATWSGAHPKTCLAVAGAVLLVAAAGAPGFHYETDLRQVFNRDVPALDAAERLNQLYERNPGPWIVAVPTVEELHEVVSRFETDPFFPVVVSAAPLFPLDLEERRARLDEAAVGLAVQRERIGHLRSAFGALSSAALADLGGLVDLLERARAQGPPTPATLPKNLATSLRAPDGSWLVFAYTGQPTTDGRRAQEERLAAWRNDERAVGVGLAIEATMAAERPWILRVLLAIGGLVVLLLIADLRSLRLAALALAPVLFGTAVTAGALSLAGVGFTPLTIAVVPLILGLGVDDGVHVVHRMAEPDRPPAHIAAGSVGRAIFMTTLTTSAGFSALLFSNHPGMEGMAVVLLVGLPLCLLASVALIPALAAVWPER